MTERERIFQQAMESCHSSNPMDCIEWFADRIAELEEQQKRRVKKYLEVVQENEALHRDKWKYQDKVKELEIVYKKALEDVVKLSDEKKEAKEIIKDLLEYFPTGFRTSTERKRAEQFIKE